MLSFSCCDQQFTSISSLFFFNDTATTEIYTLSLPDALPISPIHARFLSRGKGGPGVCGCSRSVRRESIRKRSEEHTSELQSHLNLVCRLLLEKKKMLRIMLKAVYSAYSG